MKRALIFGVTGQGGSYLAEILIEKGYEVHGLIRKSATSNTINIDHLIEDKNIFEKTFFLHKGDLADSTSIYRIINEVQPHELYNEADQDHVGWSYDMVGYSSDITGAAVARILEIIKQINPKIKFFQPCTSNMFGKTDSDIQNESTTFNPQSPYAIAKTFAYYITRYYRESFGIHASIAIFYNHESPRRTVDYVSRKISDTVAKIAVGKQDKLVLGDLEARVDWGFARDYMEAAWSILQLDSPNDFVIATGETHSVGEFADEAFKVVNLDSSKYIESSKKYMRQTKTSELKGDISKAKSIIEFEPKVKFAELVKLMVEADLKNHKQ